MTTEEERLLVLQMVAEGKLSASGAATLLTALERAQTGGASTGEERKQILKIASDGQMGATGAAKLLAALDQTQPDEPVAKTEAARWFRVRVTDLTTGKRKVNINIPMSLVNVGMKMGARFAPTVEEEDMRAVRQAIKEGVRGRILDVKDEEDGERVEIFIE